MISVFCPIDEIKSHAASQGYALREEQPDQRLLIFRKDDVQVNVWLGRRGPTVATILTHPNSGRNCLYRRRVSNEELMRILKKPRVHLRKGYRTR